VFVFGLVVGTLFERALVQTSAMGDGDLTILFTRPISVTVLLPAAVFVFAPTLVARLRGCGQGTSDPTTDSEETRV
jgi:putative tricarboxylic transport membrane protein